MCNDKEYQGKDLKVTSVDIVENKEPYEIVFTFENNITNQGTNKYELWFEYSIPQ
jgi:hypothetical protein